MSEYQVIKTSKYGLETWLVFHNNKYLGSRHGVAGARTLILEHMNKSK